MGAPFLLNLLNELRKSDKMASNSMIQEHEC